MLAKNVNAFEGFSPGSIPGGILPGEVRGVEEPRSPLPPS